jgi:hypothetical protein
MDTLTDADVQALAETVDRQAKRVARRYDCVDAEDVAQEMWLWMVEHAEWVRDKLENHSGIIALALYRAGMIYADKEWKELVPGDWRDQYTYSRPEVARLLPIALGDDESLALPGGGLHDGPSHKSDPAYSGGLLASVLDIRIAYGKLSTEDQAYLATCVDLDMAWDRVAAEFGLAGNSAYAKYMRILDRMVTRHLGRRDG